MNSQRQTSRQKQASLSGEDQWYVFKNEKEYGPLRFSELARFASQRRLLDDDLVWTPGLDSWIAAGDVSGLFAEFLPIA